ncbi:PIG-L family deacetylase [Flavihumibacter sp. UBA7668]|uniref:PIG-L family deacetylase n=1 Tax=Flavihumibacter sp. UBA7668 TaxID=1946542 RepID=UPI0025C2D0F2|nr:PIG-L family deacetylase [Flavihumibacter sp. UBA7668]
MIKHLLTIVWCGFISLAVTAQKPKTLSSADILQGMQKLRVVGAVLYIAAHPDDENTRLLAYLANERKLRTGYLSLTRGDGGQNLIGEEQGVSLGLIRTQELLAARRIDGAEQFFTRAFDFGFSKSTDEALRTWNKEKILSDVVWVIRRFKPDVIITRFPPDNRAGHGHHSASAALAIEAFKAAADPKRFPEQFVLTEPWQVKRILWNTYNFGSVNTQLEDQYKIDVGKFNPLLGKGYGEISAESRSQHKSQGFGVPAQRGKQFEYFSHTDGVPLTNDLFDGVSTDWSRIQAAHINVAIDSLIQQFNSLKPDASVPGLVKLYNQVDLTVRDYYWKDKKKTEIQALLNACLGFYAEAVANQQIAVTGDSLQINFNIINTSAYPVSDLSIELEDTSFQIATLASNNEYLNKRITRLVTEDFNKTQPYWLREQMDTGSFTVKQQELIGKAELKWDDIELRYKVGTTLFRQRIPLQYKHTDPVKGEIYQPVLVVSPIALGVSPAVVLNNLVPKHPQSLHLFYKSYRQRDTANGRFVFDLMTGDRNNQKSLSYRLPLQKNTLQSVVLPLDTLFNAKAPDKIYPWVELREPNKSVRYNNGLKLIQYDHIPTAHYFLPTSLAVINEEIKVVGKTIGYIPGSGDAIPEALEQMGYTVVHLDEATLGGYNLNKLDAIITGVRAYNVMESLSNHYSKLMAYVEAGGNMIVQYNTSNQLGSIKSKIGPYNFNISRTRITDENAPVKFVNPTHAVLNFPNKITLKDFEGWKQERSIYHASDFDSRFETILSMNDPDEKSEEGSLIIAKFGKGYFTYTGLVFFRQLPAGVSGSYRLLANLIGLNQKKQF